METTAPTGSGIFFWSGGRCSNGRQRQIKTIAGLAMLAAVLWDIPAFTKAVRWLFEAAAGYRFPLRALSRPKLVGWSVSHGAKSAAWHRSACCDSRLNADLLEHKAESNKNVVASLLEC